MVLQAIRERLTGIIAIFIFSILIIPFAFVGVNSYFTSDAVNSVALVNDVEISVTDFSQGFQNYRRRMQAFLGERFDAEEFDQPIIRRQYLDSLIDQELLTQVSVESGLSVDDESLALAIREMPAFLVDGEFNADVYQSRLLGQGSSPQEFENQMRSQLILDQFPGTISSSAISTDWELKEFVRLQNQERAFKAIVVTADIGEEAKPEPDAEDNAEAAEDETAEEAAAEELAENTDPELEEPLADVDEAAIMAWYESHPEDYRSEEQVIIEYVELDAAVMVEDLSPDEEMLLLRFEEQKARFITPETRQASHILLEVEADADEASSESTRQLAADLVRRAREGEDFAALATEHSQDAGSATVGGDLGWVEPGFMVQAFEDGLYELSLDQPISEPVETGFGWHVIQLRDIRPAEGMTFAEASEILLEEYRAEMQERKYIEQADRLIDLIYEDPTTLGSANEVLGLEIFTAGPFSRAGDTGIAANRNVVSAAFSDLVLQQGVVSDPVDLAENHIVMVRVIEHMPEDLLPLQEVRDQVIATVRRDRAMKEASAVADGFLAQLQSGADIAVLAEEASIELLQTEAARRIGSGFPGDLLNELFRLPRPEEGQPGFAILPLSDGFAVVQLDAVMDGELTEGDLVREQNYRRRIANASSNAEALGFVRMLRSQSEIEVFEDRL
jgi:peptidyl-prolyl cis-trans isomerase D